MVSSVRIHGILWKTKALGPGTRVALWLQGCERRCEGCMSLESRPLTGGKVVSIQKLAEKILKVSDTEGITISGGEPFLQADALYALLKELRKCRDFGVIIYTGYTVEELKALHNEKIDAILNGLADLIIDGEYVERLNDGRSLIGSANQVPHFLTERYKPYAGMYTSKTRNVEIIATQDEVLLAGIPDRAMLKTWMQMKKAFRTEG